MSLLEYITLLTFLFPSRASRLPIFRPAYVRCEYHASSCSSRSIHGPAFAVPTVRIRPTLLCFHSSFSTTTGPTHSVLLLQQTNNPLHYVTSPIPHAFTLQSLHFIPLFTSSSSHLPPKSEIVLPIHVMLFRSEPSSPPMRIA